MRIKAVPALELPLTATSLDLRHYQVPTLPYLRTHLPAYLPHR